MTCFKNGKKVSLTNVTQAPIFELKKQNDDRLPIQEDEMAHELSAKYMSEPSLHNFYEYLCGSGAFSFA